MSPRDAGRSRAALLDAAERLFAERGFDGASLGAVAAAAGLSHQMPTYVFGSKERLYAAVLERVFAARQEATAAAFAPLAAAAGEHALPAALEHAVRGYVGFLRDRPTFVSLLLREELVGGERLRRTPHASTAMQDAFTRLREATGAPFDPAEAVLLFVSLTFGPLALQRTFLPAVGRRVGDEHVALVVGQLLHLVGGR